MGLSFPTFLALRAAIEYFYIDVPANASSLTVQLAVGPGDPDIYVGTSYPHLKRPVQHVTQNFQLEIMKAAPSAPPPQEDTMFESTATLPIQARH